MTRRLEAASTPEIDTRQHGMEVLTPKRYALAGRLIMASVASPTELNLVLNPEKDIQTTVMPGLATKIENPTTPRNVSQITHALSTREREAEWRDQDLSIALREWVRGFTTYATTTSKEGRKVVIGGLAGKDIADFTPEDSKRLYDTFCEKDSNTGAFVDATIGRLKGPDGKVDTTKLLAEIDDIQWLASRFFGVETAKAVAELIKVEAELTNNRENTIKVLLRDSTTSRIDSLYPEEGELLRKLLGEPLHTRDTATTEPAATTTLSTPTPTAPATPPAFPPAAALPTTPTTPVSEPIAVDPVLPRESVTTPISSGAPVPPAGAFPRLAVRPRPPIAPAVEGFVSTIPGQEPAPESIDEAKLQEAKNSEAGREVTRILDAYKTLIEREYNAEPEEGDQEEKGRLIKELDDAIGNKGIVIDTLGMIHKLYKSLSEGRQTPAYKNNREEFLTQNPHFKTLDEDVTQEEAKLYIAAHKNTEPPVTAAVLDEDEDTAWIPLLQQTPVAPPAPMPIAPGEEDVMPEGAWDGRGPTTTEPAPEAQGAQAAPAPIDQREPEQDAAEPPIAPPTVRTEEAVLTDIAQAAEPKTKLEILTSLLSTIQTDIDSIDNGSFRGPGNKELPLEGLKRYRNELVDQKANVEAQIAAEKEPLYSDQDDQAEQDPQPFPQEDTPQAAEPIVEESLDPLRPEPEPPFFQQQDAVQAAEPEQPAVTEEATQQQQAENTGIIGGILRRLRPEDTAE